MRYHSSPQTWTGTEMAGFPPKFHVHFTPTHALWLNQVELWFNLLHKKVIDRDEFPDNEDYSGKIVGSDFSLS